MSESEETTEVKTQLQKSYHTDRRVPIPDSDNVR